MRVSWARWTNAFGTSRHGRDEIVSYPALLYADEPFAAGKPIGPPQAAIRFVGDDVAVLKTYMDARDEQTLDTA